TLRAGEIASNNNFKFTGTDIQLDSMKRIHASGYWFLESGGYLDVRSNNGLRVKDRADNEYMPIDAGRVRAHGGLIVGGSKGEYVYTNAVQNNVSGTHIYVRTVTG